jgi:hypothetical protein
MQIETWKTALTDRARPLRSSAAIVLSKLGARPACAMASISAR